MKRIAALALAAAGVFAVLAVSHAGQGRPAAARDFALNDLAGKSVTLASIKEGKKAVLINFWATWCPSCRKEIPELMKLRDRLAASGFAVAGIDVGEPGRRVESFVRKHGVDYPVLLDPDSSVAKSYGVVGLPVSYLIDADGRVLGEYHEYSDELAADAEKAVR